MTISDDERWSRVKGRLRAELGEDVYSSWFARMDLEAIDKEAVRLSVPTRFLKSWIQSHYAERVLACWQAEEQEVSRIELIVRSAVLVEKDVHSFVEAHERDWHRAFANREDDRIEALHQGELVDSDRNCVGPPNLTHVEDRAHLHLPVLSDVQRFGGSVEEWQILGRGGGRHPDGLLGIGLTASPPDEPA